MCRATTSRPMPTGFPWNGAGSASRCGWSLPVCASPMASIRSSPRRPRPRSPSIRAASSRACCCRPRSPSSGRPSKPRSIATAACCAASSRIPVRSRKARRRATFAIDVTGGNGRVTLAGILPATQQVKSVAAHAMVDAATRTMKIERIDADFGAAKILITGTGTKTPEGQVFAGRAEVRHIPVDRLGDYWPLDFATGGRQWALANLSNGDIDVAAEFALSAPGNDLAQIKVDRLVGLIDYRGMTVRYMPQMPEMQRGTGQARYEGDTLHFDVASGSAAGVR